MDPPGRPLTAYRLGNVITAFHHPDTTLHTPGAEIWVGVPIAGTEVPGRVDAIHDALLAAGVPTSLPRTAAIADLETIHEPGMIRFLQTAWARWNETSYPIDPGQDRVVPYAFPLRQMTSGRAPKVPTSIGAEAGMWAMDTMTLIGPGSWEAMLAGASCAIAAADLVAKSRGHAYGLTRPPGHHAGRDFYGGSCYLNNAAIAAQRLREQGAERVAIVDLDAHHGNGTQEIMYERPDVFYGSVHVDPARGWFPHFVGYPDERGAGSGEGHNLNIGVPPGCDDVAWLAAVDGLVGSADPCDAVVVSLGVDAARDDPESPLDVTVDGFRRAGTVVGRIGRPTVVVQEGGYHLDTLGALVVAFLDGLEDR